MSQTKDYHPLRHQWDQGTGQMNGLVHPGEKGSFIGKDHFGFHLDGNLTFTGQSMRSCKMDASAVVNENR